MHFVIHIIFLLLKGLQSVCFLKLKYLNAFRLFVSFSLWPTASILRMKRKFYVLTYNTKNHYMIIFHTSKKRLNYSGSVVSRSKYKQIQITRVHIYYFYITPTTK